MSQPDAAGVPGRSGAATALAWLLRLGGVLTCSAFLTVWLPVDTMQSVHRDLGLGELTTSPVVEYMARSLSLLYGFHGVLLFVVASDVHRHLAIVRFLGWMNVLFGLAILAVDLHAGLPPWWSWVEGPPVTAVGVVLLLLARRVAAPDRSAAWELLRTPPSRLGRRSRPAGSCSSGSAR